MKLVAIKWSNLAQHIHSYLLVLYITELNTYAHTEHIYWDICGRKNTHFICINMLRSKLHCIHVIKTEIIF
jgi:hypothetical protein